MPQFYEWCDLCLKFYPISTAEWEKQLIGSARIALSDDPKIRSMAGKQLCRACKEKIAAARKSKRKCRKASIRKNKR